MEATHPANIKNEPIAIIGMGYLDDKTFDRNRTSVFVGVTGTQEMVIKLGSRLGHPIWRQALLDAGISTEKTTEVVERIKDAYVPWQESSFPGLLGNVIAGRISNRLDLGGTNCVVDAACASSISALNLATLDLAAGRSDGKSQSIYAPRLEGQAKALRMAYRDAGVDPATVELIEAHGNRHPCGR